MADTNMRLNYGDVFELKKGSHFIFPDFTLDYLRDYDDPVPDNFPNKNTNAFKEKILVMASGEDKKEIALSEGTGLVTPKKIAFNSNNFILNFVNKGYIITKQT